MKTNEKHLVTFSKKNFLLQGSGLFSFKYDKMQILGSGGFAKVYRVKHIITKESFACKELPVKKIKDKEKFKNEINIMSQCDHPNIIKLVEIYEDKMFIQLIMEECFGGTLFDRLLKNLEEEDEAFSEKEAAKIFKQIMSAIYYCHKQGIAHRDLKMENVLFVYKTEDSPIKVIDFGLSEFQSLPENLLEIISGEKNMIMTGSVGTPHYISPEVMKGKYNQKCDIWSAGVILYAMLSGSFPFEGKTDKDIYKAILKRKYDFKKDIWKNISDEAKDLISHLLCDEDKRYTAEMTLNHPWVEHMAPNAAGNITKLNVKHLEDYKNICNFKKFILTYIASRLKEKEIKDLKELFNAIDTNKDGVLSLEEIKNCLIKILGKKISNDEILSLFKGIDTNNSQKIEYTEFISALIENNEFLKEEKLYDVFKILDKDKNGKISKSELKKALNDEDIDEEELNQFIKIFDLNGDGEIDYDEFITNMSEIAKDIK